MRPARKLKKWVKADDHSKGQTNRRFKAAKSSNGRLGRHAEDKLALRTAIYSRYFSCIFGSYLWIASVVPFPVRR